MESANPVTLFLCGDVMTGRGIDQILRKPSEPTLYEPIVRKATRYVELAEELSGQIPRHVDYAYVWGDALEEFQRISPDVRIINLETSITTSSDWWPGKGINYRMHPDNVSCLVTASIDCCAVANNHVLDWGYAGLKETLASLDRAGIHTAGAGGDLRKAREPAIVETKGAGRVLVFSYGSETSGIPREWAASADKPGVSLIADCPAKDAEQIRKDILRFRRRGDIVVASIHWGGNWGYAVPNWQRKLAHLLIERAHVDVVHGHSSHHPKGVELHHGRLILYGCGDFLNDYEGISGHEGYRPELSLMYFVTIDAHAGKLTSVEMVPLKIKRFTLYRASWSDAVWLKDSLSQACSELGTAIELSEHAGLTLSGMPTV